MPPIAVTIRALVIHDNKLLMCKLKAHHDWHCLPGGKLEPGETLEAGLEREITEETGIKPVVGRLAFIHQWIDPHNHRVEFFFLVNNAADYLNLDHTTASHGYEVNSFVFGDASDPAYNLLPAFLRGRFPDLLTHGQNFPIELVNSSAS